MKFVWNAFGLLVVSLALAGCQKTVASNEPAGAAAYEAIAVTQPATGGEYRLRTGDRIDVRVLREDEFSKDKVLVDQSGNVSLPLIGSVPAAGQTQDELALAIRDRLAATFLRDPRVSVMIETAAPVTLAVEGDVEDPGVYEIVPGSTLLTALAQAGSPTETAKLDEVLIFRNVAGQRVGGRFDVAMIRAGAAPDPGVLPGDIVVVGYSQARGIFQDFLKAAPLFNIFVRY